MAQNEKNQKIYVRESIKEFEMMITGEIRGKRNQRSSKRIKSEEKIRMITLYSLRDAEKCRAAIVRTKKV